MCGFGCYGGYPFMAWIYYEVRGIVSGGPYESHQGCQPYTMKTCSHYRNRTTELPECNEKDLHNPSCKNECIPGYKTPFLKDKHFGASTYWVKQNVRQIQLEILRNGPVQASVQIYEDFLNYKSGVYQHVTGKYAGGHAVRIIGWGVENGTDYWLVANSWNANWASI